MAYTEEDKRNHIREVQKFLRNISAVNEKIPAIIIDGVYDDATRDAVRIFQHEYGLPETSEVDTLTWNTLAREHNGALEIIGPPVYIIPFTADSAVVSVGDSGNLIFIIQAMLDTVSGEWDNLESIRIDGIFGDNTASAVRSFQRLSGLPETGDVDSPTWNRLARSYNSANAKV